MRYLFSLIVVIVAVLSIVFPPIFTWTSPFIVPLLGVAMLGMGLTLKVQDFKAVLKAPKTVLVGLAAQYTIMPLLALLLIQVFQIPKELAIGFILVGCCPGGTSSNVMTHLAKGDVALSVSMTACSTLLSPIVTPLLTLLLAGQWLDVNAGAMFLSILEIVIGPIIAGMIIGRLLGKARDKAAKITPVVSMASISIIIGAVISVNAASILKINAATILAVVLHNVLGLGLGYLVGTLFKLDKRRRRTLSLEVGLQNSGLATSLASLHFALMPQAMIPSAIFSVWHNFSGAGIASIWAGKKENKRGADEPQDIDRKETV